VQWTVPVSLVNGDYSWQVASTDDASQSAWSDLRDFTVGMVPPVPTVISTEAYRLGAGLRFQKVPNDYEAPVLDYTVTAMPGN